MNRTARTFLLVLLVVAAVLLSPFYMGHLLGGITAGFVVLGVATLAIIAALGAILVSAAGILAAFLIACLVLLAVLSPVLVPVALFVGFIWLIVKLASKRPAPPASPTAPAASA